jgi:hypothetical protein
VARSRLAATLLLAAGSLAGAALWRRRGRRRDHVDLYFADGSMVSFEEGSAGAVGLLSIARRVLAQAR